jgi:hypothetical protein
MPKIYRRATRTVIWLGPGSFHRFQGSPDETEDEALFVLAESIFRISQDSEELSIIELTLAILISRRTSRVGMGLYRNSKA